MKNGITRSNMAKFLLSGLMMGTLVCGGSPASAQTTPNFGPNVYIFDPSMTSTSIQATLSSLSNEAQFSTNRYAVLFKPGTYTVDSQLGYYESVGGLGQTPDAVVINGGIRVEGIVDPGGNTDNATVNFWRSVENISVTPTGGSTRWAVHRELPSAVCTSAGYSICFLRNTATRAADSSVTQRLTGRSRPRRSNSGTRATAASAVGQAQSGTWSSLGQLVLRPSISQTRRRRRFPQRRWLVSGHSSTLMAAVTTMCSNRPCGQARPA